MCPVGWLVWLVCCFGFSGPLRPYFSIYRPSPREKEKRERIEESKNVLEKVLEVYLGPSHHPTTLKCVQSILFDKGDIISTSGYHCLIYRDLSVVNFAGD